MNITPIARLVFDEESVSQAWLAKMQAALGDTPFLVELPALEALVRQRYSEDPKAFDGYSRLAYYLLSKDEDLQTALRLFDLDAIGKRQTWFQQLRHAECTAATGNLDRALAMVKKVYAAYPEAVNGHASIAWHLRHKAELLPSPYSCAKRDLTDNRIGAGFMLNVAELAMAEDLVNDATQLIEQAYVANPSLTDGYARCAWLHYWPNKEYAKLIGWMEKDHAAGKLSPSHLLNLALAYAASGAIEKAWPLVEQAYSANPFLTDGYARCAWLHYWPNKEHAKLIGWMEKDLAAGKLSPPHLLNLALAYAASGAIEKATPLVEDAYARDITLTDGFTKLAVAIYTPSHAFDAVFRLHARDIALNRLTDQGRHLMDTLRDRQIVHLSARVNALEQLAERVSNLENESTFMMNAMFPVPLKGGLNGVDEWLENAKDKHKGQRCFILATGPSLNKIDLSKLHDEILFGVNGTYKLSDVHLTYFTYVSNWYWKHHVEGIRSVRCERRFIPGNLSELASSVPTSWLNVFTPRYFTGDRQPLPVPSHFSVEPGKYIFSGGTVLYLCFQLAFYMGFKEIILLGVDHSYGKEDVEAKQHGGTIIKLVGADTAHFDKDYVPDNIAYHVDLDAMERGYEIVCKVFTNDGRRVLNASPGTHLTTFPVVSYNDLF